MNAECGVRSAEFTTRAGMVPAVVDAEVEDSARIDAPQCPSARLVQHEVTRRTYIDALLARVFERHLS